MGEVSDKVIIDDKSILQLAQIIASNSFSQIFVLADENTLQHCYTKISPHLPLHQIIQIQSGEEGGI